MAEPCVFENFRHRAVENPSRRLRRSNWVERALGLSNDLKPGDVVEFVMPVCTKATSEVQDSREKLPEHELKLDELPTNPFASGYRLDDSPAFVFKFD